MVFIELRRRATAGEGVKELKEVSAVTLTGVQRTLLEGGGIMLVGGCGRLDTELRYMSQVPYRILQKSS